MSRRWFNDKVRPVTALELLTPESGLSVGQKVKLTGVSKGRGYAGVVKRHHFAGGPKTHGQSDRWRSQGSMGSTTTPGRVYKGKRMSGRMGGERVSLKTEILEVSGDGRTVFVRGGIPGSFGQSVYLKIYEDGD